MLKDTSCSMFLKRVQEDRESKINIKFMGDEEPFVKRALRLIKEVVSPDPIILVRELIQNAHDAYIKLSTRGERVKGEIEFIIGKSSLKVVHFGKPFDENDVLAICNALKSTKEEDPRLIGKYGIGFKAVFNLTENPKVFSGGFHFEIRDYVVPYEISVPKDVVKILKSGGTVFIFPYKDKRLLDSLRNSILNQTYLMRLLLFIGHEIKLVKITDNIGKIKLIVKCDSSVIRRGDVTICLKKISSFFEQRGKKKNLKRENWIILWRICKVDGKTVDVGVAIKLEKGEIRRPKEPTIYAFFPTNIRTGLGFHMHSDFMITKDRKEFYGSDEAKKWNYSLLELGAKLAVDAFLYLRNLDIISNKIKLFNILLAEEISGRVQDVEITNYVYSCIIDCVKDKEIILTEDGEWSRPEDVILVVEPELRKLINKSDIEKIFGKKLDVVHPKISKDKEIRKFIQSLVDKEGKPIVKRLTHKHLLEFIKKQEHVTYKKPKWFTLLYSYFLGKLKDVRIKEEEKKKIIDDLKASYILLLKGNNICKPFEYDQIYFPGPQQLKKDLDLFTKIKFVSPAVLYGRKTSKLNKKYFENAREFLEKFIEIKKFNATELIRSYIVEVFESGEWKKLVEEKRIQFLDFIRRHQKSLSDEDFVKIGRIVRVKGYNPSRGTYVWEKPIFIYFSSAYVHDNSLEELFSDISNVIFLADDYLHIPNRSNKLSETKSLVEDWYSFFKKIGVEDKLRVIVQEEKDSKGFRYHSEYWEYSTAPRRIKYNKVSPDLDKLLAALKDALPDIVLRKLEILIKMLKNRWKEYEKELRLKIDDSSYVKINVAKYNWFYYSPQSKPIPSYFMYSLRELLQIIIDKVRNSQLYERKEWKNILFRFYNFLAEIDISPTWAKDHYYVWYREREMVFLPNTRRKFWKPANCFINNFSEYFDTYRGYIVGNYDVKTHKKLIEFLKRIGVKEHPEKEDFFKFLKDLAELNIKDYNPYKLLNIYTKLGKTLYEEFPEEVEYDIKIITENGDFKDPTECFWNDEDTLYNYLKDYVDFAKLPAINSFAIYFLKKLGVRPISKVVDTKLSEVEVEHKGIPWAKRWEEKLKRAAKYFPIYWNSKSPELLNYLDKSVQNWRETLEKLEVVPTRSIKLQLKIGDKIIEKPYEPDAFFDYELGKLFIKMDSTNEAKIAHEISKIFEEKRGEVELSFISFIRYDSEEEIINMLKNLGIRLTREMQLPEKLIKEPSFEISEDIESEPVIGETTVPPKISEMPITEETEPQIREIPRSQDIQVFEETKEEKIARAYAPSKVLKPRKPRGKISLPEGEKVVIERRKIRGLSLSEYGRDYIDFVENGYESRVKEIEVDKVKELRDALKTFVQYAEEDPDRVLIYVGNTKTVAKADKERGIIYFNAYALLDQSKIYWLAIVARELTHLSFPYQPQLYPFINKFIEILITILEKHLQKHSTNNS